MPKRKLTKHEDDIRRGLRPIDRYEPRARSIGGAWRMVKCIDGAYVDAEQHDEMIDNLRSVAEDNKRECEATRIENARLKAEVELLREAGDEVVSRIQVCTEDLWCSIHRWNAAREGKQP